MNLEKFQQQLFNSAIKYLTFRPRSKGELEELLYKKVEKRISSLVDSEEKIDPVVLANQVKPVIDKIADLRLINDEDFAKHWIKSRLSKGKGLQTVAYELKRKQVDQEIINRLILVNEQAEIESCQKVIDKKAPQINRKYAQPFQRKGKIYEFLRRRGFSLQAIRACVD